MRNGEPLATAAAKAGANELLKYNAVYPFASGGAWVTNVVWGLLMVRRNGTAREFVEGSGFCTAWSCSVSKR